MDFSSRLVTRETNGDGGDFPADIVTRAIKSCRNSKAFGPDKLRIFYLKNLGPRAIEYITALFNLSVTNCQIPAIWKSSLIIPIPKPGKDTSQECSYRSISLLCPAAKVLESLILPTINKYLQPDQHGFRQEHSTTSALLQLTTDMAMGFNQRKPPDRTVCVAVDLLAAFDTVCHNKLLSKINRSPLPSATSRWLSSYLRGRQAKTCFRGVKSSSRKVHAGVPQGSKLSPSLFSFYTWWNRPEEDNSSGKLESTHPSRTSVKSDQVFFGVESVMRVNADSLLIRAAATSTSGTLNDLTTDLIMANNNNANRTSQAGLLC